MILISYDGLWKQLRKKKKNKQRLVNELRLSSATVAKLGKNQAVAWKVLDKLCEYLECKPDEIISLKYKKN